VAGMVNAQEVKKESGRRIPPILPQLLSAVVANLLPVSLILTGGE
jgi:hypothetical protein